MGNLLTFWKKNNPNVPVITPNSLLTQAFLQVLLSYSNQLQILTIEQPFQDILEKLKIKREFNILINLTPFNPENIRTIFQLIISHRYPRFLMSLAYYYLGFSKEITKLVKLKFLEKTPIKISNIFIASIDINWNSHFSPMLILINPKDIFPIIKTICFNDLLTELITYERKVVISQSEKIKKCQNHYARFPLWQTLIDGIYNMEIQGEGITDIKLITSPLNIVLYQATTAQEFPVFNTFQTCFPLVALYNDSPQIEVISSIEDAQIVFKYNGFIANTSISRKLKYAIHTFDLPDKNVEILFGRAYVI